MLNKKLRLVVALIASIICATTSVAATPAAPARRAAGPAPVRPAGRVQHAAAGPRRADRAYGGLQDALHRGAARQSLRRRRHRL